MLRETRNLTIVIVLCSLALMLTIISISTRSWIVLELPDGFYRNASGRWLLGARSGLWMTCRVEKWNKTDPVEKSTTVCESLVMFQSRHNLDNHPEVDAGYLDYRLTSAAFSIVALVLLILGLVAGLYCLKEPRYMFKRLTAALFFMSAIAELVTIEVLVTSLTYAASRLPARIPNGSYLHYGYSFFLSWFIFLIQIVAGFTFLVYSRKRKGADAANEEIAMANEPVQLGR